MSNDLDLKSKHIEHQGHTNSEDEVDTPLDLTTQNKTELNPSAQNLNKRKKKPTKSLLLLKCVDNPANQEEEIIDEEHINKINEEPDLDIDQNSSPMHEDHIIADLENETSGTNLIEDEEEEDEEDRTSSFESESNYDFLNQCDEKEVKQQIRKRGGFKHTGFSTQSINHSPLSTNGFINNRNLEIFAQNYLNENASTQQTSPIITHKQGYNSHTNQSNSQTVAAPTNQGSSKKQMRFQCRFCVYKSHSVSLMQNHIYRHIDTTPYSCFYCGHKSTTKSTIMVHIELCHPNMEVKIKESRVKEEDYYIDLNSASNSNSDSIKSIEFLKENKHNLNKFEIIPKKCHMTSDQQDKYDTAGSILAPPPPPPPAPVQTENLVGPLGASLSSLSSASLSSTVSNSSNSSSGSSVSSLCSSPSVSPAPPIKEESMSLTVNPEHLKNSGFSADHTFENDDEQQVNVSGVKDGNNYVTVFNRPKQYFGSLYEPDKQYSCKLCTYTTNHKPSMEDHVYVHTNKRPYRCGYCDEEIYTRYAATYHNKYKHPGEPRNFIKDEQDVSIYYVNRAKGGNNNNANNSSTSNNSNSNNTNFTDRQQTSDTSSNNDTEEANYHQYGVVAQHRVLDSKQRCPDLNTKYQTSTDYKLERKLKSDKNSNLKASKHHQQQSPNSSSSSFSSTGSPQSQMNNEFIKVTSFRTAQLGDEKTKLKKSKTKLSNECQESPQLDPSQFLMANQGQNAMAFNAFSNYFLGNQTSFQKPTSPAPSTSNNNIASALTQFMLSQGFLGNNNSQPQQMPGNLQSIFNSMNPLTQSFNSTTTSPSSSTNSNSSSLSTSPSTSNTPQSATYDFNLAMKMYQIQLQNLMTANYLQNFRATSGTGAASSVSPNMFESKPEGSETKKRKADESNELNAEEDTELYSSPDSPDAARISKSLKLNSSQFKVLNKKSSKHII